MKVLNVCLFLVMITCSFPAAAQVDLHVTVKNFEDNVGSVHIGLFDRESDFLEKALDGKVRPVTADSVTVVFENLKPGGYAISAFHDANGNGKLDTNLIGIPKEAFAFGNNVMGLFGPPSFHKARITLRDKNRRQVLILKHF
jgi:uncharacterized protein (DUF2141 family)